VKILITGGCGFVGLNLLCALADRDVSEILLVDNLSNSSVENLDKVIGEIDSLSFVRAADDRWSAERKNGGALTVRLIQADIRDAAAMMDCCEGMDTVVNLAAQSGVPTSLADPRFDCEQNVMGTFNLLEACRASKVKTFITASSAAVLGDSPPPQSEDQRMLPLSPYGASKAASEIYCSAYYAAYGLQTLAFRFSNVYGPYSWRKGSVVALFIKKLLSGEPVCINGDGSQRRDFLYVRDLAETLASAATGQVTDPVPWGQAVNVSTGVQTSIATLAACLEKEASRTGLPWRTTSAEAREGDVSASAPSPQRLKALMPQVTMRRLEEGLPATVDWFVRETRTN